MGGMKDLFGDTPWRPQPTEQEIELARVTGKIGRAVQTFVRKCGIGGFFHAQELHDFVGRSVAPASADRILRELRKQGWFDYDVINRRSSLYQITAIKEDAP